jgi:hypothetical protein
MISKPPTAVRSTFLDAEKFLAMSDKEKQKVARKLLKALGNEWKNSQPQSPHEIEDDLL